MPIGQHLCFWENGALRELSYWDEGYAVGTFVRFHEDGTKESERDFGEYGGRTRSWLERTYMNDGRLLFVHVYKEDALIAKWTRPELREIMEAVGMEEIARDAVRELYPDDPSVMD